MAHDLEQFSEEALPFTVEFQGKELDFFCKPVSIEEFFSKLRSTNNATANMRTTFRSLLLDENQVPVSKDWIEKLISKPALIPLGIKINAAINTALGLDEIAAKKA